jgi:hypothetical protein
VEPKELIQLLDTGTDTDLEGIYRSIQGVRNEGGVADTTQAQRDALAAVVQGVHIREMKRLDKAAGRLSKVGIGVAVVGVLLAAVQVWVALKGAK